MACYDCTQAGMVIVQANLDDFLSHISLGSFTVTLTLKEAVSCRTIEIGNFLCHIADYGIIICIYLIVT